jgi:large subunit ribosomal protein L25
MAKKKSTKKKTSSSSKRPVLEVEKRKLIGRKVKELRRDGIIPASVYGKEIESMSIKANLQEVKDIFHQVGETSLVDLAIKGEKKSRPVLLKNPQYDPITDNLLHLDFHQVDLTQKVTAEVPVELIGKSPAAESGEGVLVQLVDELEVEALPTELPEKFVVDISGLKEVDDAVAIADLEKYSKKVEIKAEKDQILAKVEPLLEEIEEPVTPEEELLVGEEELVEGEEGAEVPEGEIPPEKAGEEGQEKPAEKETDQDETK